MHVSGTTAWLLASAGLLLVATGGSGCSTSPPASASSYTTEALPARATAEDLTVAPPPRTEPAPAIQSPSPPTEPEPPPALSPMVLGAPKGVLPEVTEPATRSMGGVRVAFVDFQRIVQKCRASRLLRSELDRRVADNEFKKKAAQQLLTQLSDEVNALPDGETKKQKEGEFLARSVDYKMLVEKQAIDLDHEQKRSAIQIYQQVGAIVTEMAKKEGFQAVFKVDAVPLADSDLDLVSYEIDTCILFYHADATDITEEVLKKLDETFDLGK